MLTQEYIQGLVEGVIASKEARRRVPTDCTAAEVVAELTAAVRHFLNRLVADGVYGVYRDVNKVPHLIRPKATNS